MKHLSFLFVSVISTLHFYSTCHGEEITAENWKPKAIKAWHQYIDRIPNFKGTVSRIERSYVNGSLSHEYHRSSEIIYYPPYARSSCIPEKQKGDLPCGLSLANDKYGAVLNREKGSTGLLVEAIYPGEGPKNESVKHKLIAQMLARNPRVSPVGSLLGCLRVCSMSLLIATESPDFVIKDVQPIRFEENDLVQIMFTWSPEDKGKDQVRSGRIYLNPDRYWLPVRAFVELEYIRYEGEKAVPNEQATAIVKYEYQEGVLDEIPVLSKFSVAQEGKPLPGSTVKHNSAGGYEITYQFEPIESVDPEEFYLSHYGIPEPDLPVVNKFSYFYYLLIFLGGAALVTIAIYLKKRSSASL